MDRDAPAAMKSLLTELSVTCPSCWEQHPVLIDLTDEQRTLIEDCQVCCNPMQISYQLDDDEVRGIDATPLY